VSLTDWPNSTPPPGGAQKSVAVMAAWFTISNRSPCQQRPHARTRTLLPYILATSSSMGYFSGVLYIDINIFAFLAFQLKIMPFELK
jgi:hypothetical protein